MKHVVHAALLVSFVMFHSHCSQGLNPTISHIFHQHSANQATVRLKRATSVTQIHDINLYIRCLRRFNCIAQALLNKENTYADIKAKWKRRFA